MVTKKGRRITTTLCSITALYASTTLACALNWDPTRPKVKPDAPIVAPDAPALKYKKITFEKDNTIKNEYSVYDKFDFDPYEDKVVLSCYDQYLNSFGEPQTLNNDEFSLSLIRNVNDSEEDVALTKDFRFSKKMAGDWKLKVSCTKEGYADAISDTSFNIKVNEVGELSQSLTFSTNPVSYLANVKEGVNLNKISLQLNSNYASSTGTTTSTDTVKDFVLFVNDQKVDRATYKFPKMGTYKISLGVKGWDFSKNEDSATLDDYVSTSYYVDVYDSTFNKFAPDELANSTLKTVSDSTNCKVSVVPEGKGGNTNSALSSNVINAFNLSTDSFREKGKLYGKSAKDFIDTIPNDSTKTVKKLPILVVPVATTDEEYNYYKYNDPSEQSVENNKYRALVQRAFFADDDTMHYQSLRSYFYKSSFGKFDINGCITPCINTAHLPDMSNVSNPSFLWDSNSNVSEVLAQYLPNILKSTAFGYNDAMLKKFDLNDDGVLDCVYFISMHAFDETTAGYTTNTRKYEKHDADVNDVIVGNYSYLSINHLNGQFDDNTKNIQDWDPDHLDENEYLNDNLGDSHILIHEMGKMLGLQNLNSTTDLPVGYSDMMDGYNGDLNSYSKMLLGWTTPNLVLNAQGGSEFNLESAQLKDNVIVIPYDNKSYSKNSNGKYLFNVFDEYLVAELYTDNELNGVSYSHKPSTAVKKNGVRIYHVDSRLVGRKADDDSSAGLTLINDSLENTEYVSLEKLITNENEDTTSGLTSEQAKLEEIRLLSATKLTLTNTANEGVLLRKNYSFSMKRADFGSNFINRCQFDNKTDSSFTLTVKELNE